MDVTEQHFERHRRFLEARFCWGPALKLFRDLSPYSSWKFDNLVAKMVEHRIDPQPIIYSFQEAWETRFSRIPDLVERHLQIRFYFDEIYGGPHFQEVLEKMLPGVQVARVHLPTGPAGG